MPLAPPLAHVGEPCPARPARAGEPIDVTRHLLWARAIARGVRADYRFLLGSQEEQDLQAVAWLTVLRLAKTFDSHRVPEGGDPDGQFRGWAHPTVQSECKREAIRLWNDGMYWTRREKGLKPVRAVSLSRLRAADACEQMDVPDHRGDIRPALGDEQEGEWSPYCTEL